MQRVTVVINRIQSLKRCTDIIKVNFLRVQTSSRGLDVVFQHLRPWVGAILLFQSFGPNPSSYTTNNGILWIYTVGKEERKIGTKFVDVHSPAQIILYVGKPIGKRECQLGNRVSTRLCNMVTGNGNGIEITNLLFNKIFLHISHQSEGKLR